ncbi:hypothetical protein [Pseudomonas sp. W4I3]|uniref:hypothetical protein n=1 Tax=Pseudomonas sp. W4I3 TaxID=3042294 RepID=UPI00278963EB|nr:hypothetical protein [Pseudomonas sp. W4I3]MDQ0742449.1 hypothetical protein [Pseudomonas sp. W4I3]
MAMIGEKREQALLASTEKTQFSVLHTLANILPVAPRLYAAHRSSWIRSTLVSADVNGFQIEYKQAVRWSAIRKVFQLVFQPKNKTNINYKNQ